MPDEKNGDARTEREQTDESLRSERARVDTALDEALAAIEEAADATIIRARDRADAVVAKTRAAIDRMSPLPVPSAAVQRDRAREDRAVSTERAAADEILREEREETVELLSTQRAETDQDLVSERALSDEALSTRDEFLGIVSHDLRNMLHAVMGFAATIDTIVARDGDVDQVRTCAQRIQRSGGRMNRLIGDLVDVASIEAGVLTVSREPTDPGPVVTEAIETFQAHAAANGVEMSAEIVPPAIVPSFDPARMLQVLINLLSNAIKFTPRGGKVVARVELTGDDLRFTVTDTGIGIPSDKLKTIFDRFLQLGVNDRRGVGLGLYISRCIVQGHGGRIWAESTVGKGTRIVCTIPAAPSE